MAADEKEFWRRMAQVSAADRKSAIEADDDLRNEDYNAEASLIRDDER